MSADGNLAAARRESLELANRVRALRADLKEQLRCRHINIIAVLLDPPECCDKAPIGDVLRWAPKVGRVKADTVLRELRMSPSTRLGLMSDARRRQLANHLVERFPSLHRELA